MSAPGPTSGGSLSTLNCSAATVVKNSPGILNTVVVTTAGTAGAVYDHATTSGVSAANLIAVIPATVGPLVLNWPCQVGIVYVPGSGQVASIAYT